MAGQRSSLASNAFHRATITEEAVRMVVDQVIPLPIEDSSCMCLSHSKTDSIAEALTEWPGCHLNSWRIMRFGMPRCYAVYLTEVFEVVHADLVAKQMKECILQHAPMAIRQDKTISVYPVWILRIEGHELVE